MPVCEFPHSPPIIIHACIHSLTHLFQRASLGQACGVGLGPQKGKTWNCPWEVQGPVQVFPTLRATHPLPWLWASKRSGREGSAGRGQRWEWRVRGSPQKVHMPTFLTVTCCLSLSIPQPRWGQIAQLPASPPLSMLPLPFQMSLGELRGHSECSLVHVTASGPPGKRGGLDWIPLRLELRAKPVPTKV